MEDSMIVQMYLDRNEEAIRRTAEKYGSRLRSLSFGITSDEQTAEECENDTYMETWKRIPPNDPREYFYAFLARIIRFISIDCCRSRDILAVVLCYVFVVNPRYMNRKLVHRKK